MGPEHMVHNTGTHAIDRFHMDSLALNVVWKVCDWLTQFTGGGYDVLPLDIVTVEARL